VREGDLADAAATCLGTGAHGWDLVDEATRLVHDQFSTYSVLHAWERPETAFVRRRGYCTQYNGALARLLRRLGFDAWLVFAAHVQFDDDVEWALGHTWVEVAVGGEVLAACARSRSNRPGSVGFAPGGSVRRLDPLTRFASTAGTALAAYAAVAAARVRGAERPRWVEHPRERS
jgi:hypothetical protein